MKTAPTTRRKTTRTVLFLTITRLRREPCLRPFGPSPGHDPDVLKSFVMNEFGQAKARPAVSSLAIDDEGPVARNGQDFVRDTHSRPVIGYRQGPDNMALAKSAGRSGVEEEGGAGRREKVFRLACRDETDPGVLAAREESLA